MKTANESLVRGTIPLHAGVVHMGFGSTIDIGDLRLDCNRVCTLPHADLHLELSDMCL